MSAQTTEKVTVFLRIKPTLEPKNTTVQKLNDTTIVTVPPPSKTNPNPIEFQFNHILDGNATQQEVFENTAHGSIRQFLSGNEALLFAYGVTSSGKTYTIQGIDNNRGLLPRTIQTILTSLKASGSNLQLRFSMLELYDGKIRDLLYDEKNANSNKALNFLFGADKTRGYIPGQNFKTISSFEQCMKYMDLGTSRRKVSSTALNSESSRSHCVYHLQLWNGTPPTVVLDGKNDKFSEEDNSNCFANMAIIDLAGAERSHKTGAQANSTTQSETNSINASLMRLHDLIGGSRNYRGDILSKIVSRYFAGTAKITVICNINPSITEYEETVASLRWASLASKAKQQSLLQGPSSTGVLGAKTVQQLIAENEMLKAQIQQQLFNQHTAVPSPFFQQQQQQNQLQQQQQIKVLENELMEKFIFTQRAAKAKLEQDYCEYMIKQFEQQSEHFVDTWNANSGCSDSYGQITQVLEQNVARKYHQKYHAQIELLLEKNEKLTTELEEQDDLIESLQSKGMEYYNGYVDLYTKLDMTRKQMKLIQDTHNNSCNEMTKCQNHFKAAEAHTQSVIPKLVEPYADAYQALINQYQATETQLTALLQVNAEASVVPTPTSVVGSVRKTKATAASAAAAVLQADVPSTPATARTSGRKKNTTVPSTDDENFYTPIQKKKTTKVKKELNMIAEGDDENEDTDNYDDDQDEDLFDEEDDKPVAKTTKKTTTKSTISSAIATPSTRNTRSTAATAAPSTTAPATPAGRGRPKRNVTTTAAALQPSDPKVRKSSEMNVGIDEAQQPTTTKKAKVIKAKDSSKMNTEVALSSTTGKSITTSGPATRSRLKI